MLINKVCLKKLWIILFLWTGSGSRIVCLEPGSRSMNRIEFSSKETNPKRDCDKKQFEKCIRQMIKKKVVTDNL